MFCANCQRELNETEYPMQLKVCPFCGKPLQHQGSSNVKRGPFGTRRVTSTPVGNPTTSSYSSNATGNIGSYTGHVTAPAQLNHAATPLSAKGIYEPLHAPHSAGPETYHFVFTANANEFFRIWIVNLFLTIITLGVYNAWAKVRTRRYFYANTYLANYNFDYLAKPLPILRGNLIIGAGVLLYAWASRSANSNLLLIILAVFAATFPFLVYQTLRFRAYYTSYRGIRFHFHGKLGESYWVYLLSALPFLGPLASGIFSSTLSNGDIERGTTSAIVLGVLTLLFALIYPYARFLQKRYYFANMAYGTA